MASTLLLIKSKGLLPKTVEDEAEITEEELIRRIIEYKRYKEVCKTLREKFQTYSKRLYKLQEKIELPKQVLEVTFGKDDIINSYKRLLNRNKEKKNEYANNIQKIAVHDTYSVSDKVKEIYRELIRNSNFVFG